MNELTPAERKILFKEAMKEWLTEQRYEFEATVGRWFIRGVAIATVLALGYFMLWVNGWTRGM